MSKRFSILLALLMLISVVMFAASCGEKPSTTTTASSDKETTTHEDVTSADNTTTQQATEETTEEESTETELTGREKMSGFEDVDFGGKTFLIATDPRDDPDWANAADFWVESLTNDAINDAVYDRNDIIQKLYNCKIEIDNGGWANGFNASIASGDGRYILGTCTSTATNSQAKSGNFYNLLKLDVDWSQPWWDQNYIADTSTDGRLYSIIGDFAVHSMSATWIMFFNKAVYESKFSDVDIYQMVKDRKWTMDAMMDFIEKVKYDANGDSEYTFSEESDADIVGIMTTAHNDRGLYFAAGLRYVTKTDSTTDGSYISALTNQPSAVDVMDKLIAVCNTPGYISGGYTNVQKAVQNGTTLFAGEVMDVLRRMSGAESLRVGVLPQPLFDENQERYYCYVNDQMYIMLAPVAYSDMSVLSDFLTLFAYHSSMIVRPAFVNTVKYTYSSDEESAEMIDIILDSRVYDPGYITKISTDMDGYVSTIISNKKNNYTQAATKFAKSSTTNIENFRNDILAIDDNY